MRVRLGSFGSAGAMGVIFRYTDRQNYYRFSMSDTPRARRLVKVVAGVATTLWEDANHGYEDGRYYECVIALRGARLQGYLDGVPVFDVEDDDLTTGRIGLYAWKHDRVRFPRVEVYPTLFSLGVPVFEEPFAGVFASEWEIHDVGPYGGSLWEYRDGMIHQTGNIWGGGTTAANVATPGTHAVRGDATWTDYRLTVVLASDDNDEVGVVFRYVDEGNHYRFSMSRQWGVRRLVRFAGGVVQLIREVAAGYVMGRYYLVTIDAFGDRLQVSIDGERVFDERDATHPTGRVGLHCWSNTGLRVSRLRVERGSWGLIHQFARERVQPDGTVVRLHSGAPDGAPAPPGMLRRFTALAAEAGETRLRDDGARLRVVDRENRVVSSRQQLPDAAFTDCPLRLLRRADGTAFFVLVTDGVAPPRLTDPTAQLTLTYRRDNVVVDPQSPVQSRGGDTSDQVAAVVLRRG
jgi:hypothetical protein